ncbi:aromatic ring-hydroxylating oxygenase subunit alpha [Amycolatopsis sp.]|uniref:aromatic ring-hydroxylating oxygenase subunit alpha n=1 Tax=Amycolatopsis sp. TaxID=37632 RepID=UPI002C601A49|nr:SRPBCC family protein [Amycolatopsis sp.]HVV08161.1 SRPBCC family protein [Amycolatopsis sp.]
MTAQIERPAEANTLTEPEVQRCLPDPGVDTSGVPFRMADGVHIPAERYYDQGFADLENEKMWLRTWQWAARLEDIPRVGDYIEYSVVGESVMVVRVGEDTVKVYQNVCPHRATRLAQDCGSFGGGQIVCPFHGWRWNLDGSQSMLYGRRGFVPDSVDPAKMALKEVRHEVRYGFIWITFDDDAPSLDEFFGEMDEYLAPVAMERMRFRWWKYTVLPANWKVALEAFMEAYHVMQAHPELALGATGEAYNADAVPYFPRGMGHVDTTAPALPDSAFVLTESPVEGMGFGEWFLAQNQILFEGTDATNTVRDELIADRVRGKNLPDEELLPAFFQEYYAYAQDAGIPLPPPDPKASSYAFLFPNFVMLGMPGNLLYYRVRPNGTDPNSCLFEVFAMQVPIAGEEQAPARPEGPIAPDDWPFVLRQDFENIQRQQEGYRSRAFREATMSPRYETMIYTMHNEIDKYIAR